MNERIDTLAPRSVGFELRALPAVLRGLNACGRRFAIASPKLEPEQLVRAASRRAGLAPEFPAHVGEALEQLCRSLHDEARLHAFGRLNLRNLIVTGLRELLLVEDHFRRHPELDEQQLTPPLIVTGLPRSGTTHLHRLLSAPAAAAPVPLYRHLFPSPRRLPTARAEAELLFGPWQLASRRYGLDAIHFVRPGLPDECNFGMRLGMRSMIFWATAPSYGYLRWLLEQDLREAYRLYRRVLLLHQARAPGRRLTLKCPHHLAWLPALHEALPEALVVQTHREIAEVVPSECKLILSLQGLSSEAIDWRQTVAHNHHKLETFARRSLEFAETEAGRRIVHVDYRRLLREPIAVARDIHARFGLAFEAEEQGAIEAFVGANRQHKHGKNHYSLAQFELDLGQLHADFADYRAHFLAPDQ